MAEGAGWSRLVIEMRVLLALALEAQGETEQALRSLELALSLAEAESYIRVFLDEGKPMESLLREAESRGVESEYIAELLAAYEHDGIPGEPASETTLIEPLSERELEILRLLKTELSGPEIASELTIALSTVRTHTKSIYGKLNVNKRRAAVNRAEELDII
jgi:LuxR family maltose regulon positive regulatory protein